MDFQLQYFRPAGYPGAPPAYDPAITLLGASLRGVDTDQGNPVPDTALTVRLRVMDNGAAIEFDYHKKRALINFCCFEKENSKDVFSLVKQYYRRCRLGDPQKPTLARWIHLIPVSHSVPEHGELILSQQLAVSFYWAICAQRLSRAQNHGRIA